MKLKSTLWTLAFACAAVSCSDDLNDLDKGDDTQGKDKPTAYVRVTVNTGMATKAGPTGGEDGDVKDGETGEPEEYRVNDVTLILYKNAETAGATSNAFSSSSTLVAAGYATTGGITGGDDGWHDTGATVGVTIREGETEQFDGKTYGVIAVTNWGSGALSEHVLNTTDITATNLANYLVKTPKSDTNGFIMSSHKKEGETVTLKANSSPNDPAQAEVHVERLSAKIRINPTKTGESETNNNFIYTISSTTSSTGPDAGDGGESTRAGATVERAKVRLEQVALVNCLTSGSYLLKRVTPGTNESNNSIVTSGDVWLGDEMAVSNSTAGLNYVIDPWTRTKTEDGLKNITSITAATDIYLPTSETTASTTLSYDNPFGGSGDNVTYASLWGDGNGTNSGLSGKKALYQSEESDVLSAPLTLGYTQENTTQGTLSKCGYTTGALFKAVYLPKQWSETTTEEDDNKQVVKPVDVDYNGDAEGTGYDDGKATGKDFYVYQGNIYKDWEAIFNEYVWAVQKGQDASAKVYSYSDFTASTSGEGGTSTGITILSIEKFKSSRLYKAQDPFGYLAYLSGIADQGSTTKAEEGTNFQAGNALNTYLSSENNQEAVNKNVTFYQGGVCYYPFWIRHANNNSPTVMGIMEFGIVRNNIYDMTVTGISGLGLSGTDKPDPNENVEKEVYYFNVKVNVKNWVVRKNDEIIL